MSYELFPFNHSGIPDVALLVIFFVAAAILFTLLAFVIWFAFCRNSKRKAATNRRKSSLSKPELKLQATVSHRESAWQSLPLRNTLTEKERRELVKLNPSFNQHVLMPDPVPRTTPTSPVFPSPTFSAFSHTSFSPLLGSRERSLTPSIAPSVASKSDTLYAPQDLKRHGSLSSFEHSPHVPDIGVPMTGNWEGSFKAVPVERALLMSIPNPSVEELGLQRARQLRLHNMDNPKRP